MVDISIDQGGCAETSRPTSHVDPTYVESGVVHYCVANIPGAVPRTSTFALTNATAPFVFDLANRGVQSALKADVNLLRGMNVCRGTLTHQGVADSLGREYISPEQAIGL